MWWLRPNTAAREPEPDGSRVTPKTSMPRAQRQHGAAGVFNQIPRIDHVNVGRFAIGEHQDQLAMAAHFRDLGAGRQMRREMR